MISAAAKMALLGFISEDNWLTIVLATVVCLVIFLYVYWYQMPPGPTGLPYLDYYPFLSEDSSKQLFEMTKKHGKVFCFTVTGQMYAHIPDMKTIREVAVTKSDCFESRPENFTLFYDLFGGGVLQLNGEEWKVLRKFFILKLKEFGMGKKTQEGIVQDGLKKIVESLGKSDGSTFGAAEFTSIANDVIRRILFGSVRLDENDIRRFNESYVTVTEFSNRTRILLAGPILKYILIPFFPEYREYRKHKAKTYAIMGQFVKQHEKEFDRNNIRNIVDAYINERKLLEEKNDSKAKFFTESLLVSTLFQFFGDGTLGVGWVTVGILNIIASYPDVQKAIQSEIDEVVGRNRLPSLDDKSKLSYTTAAIYEGTRCINFFPLLPLLECTKETTVGGCRIPKSTITVYNIWSAFRDPETYNDPEKFDPTRFLSVDGRPRCEIPVFFGVGKRSCTGEPLVNMQLLLYVATVALCGNCSAKF